MYLDVADFLAGSACRVGVLAMQWLRMQTVNACMEAVTFLRRHNGQMMRDVSNLCVSIMV